MTKKLIALAVIAAAVAMTTADVAQGTIFEAADDIADKLIADKLAEPAPADVAPAPKVKTTKVRLLIDSPLGKANDVVSLPAADVKNAEAAGEVDSSKEAVTYALSLPQNQA